LDQLAVNHAIIALFAADARHALTAALQDCHPLQEPLIQTGPVLIGDLV
jgi:hypothetical protein